MGAVILTQSIGIYKLVEQPINVPTKNIVTMSQPKIIYKDRIIYKDKIIYLKNTPLEKKYSNLLDEVCKTTQWTLPPTNDATIDEDISIYNSLVNYNKIHGRN